VRIERFCIVTSRRSGGVRSAGLAALTLLTAAALLVAPSAVVPAVPSAAADACPDSEVIFARGTSEPPGVGNVGEAFVDALRARTPGADIGVYAVDYAASRLQLHGGDGAKDVISHVKDIAGKCSDTTLVLGGYSQGASVMDIVSGVPLGGITFGDPLPAEYAGTVAAVAVFGNPANRMGGPITNSALLGSKAIDLCNTSDPICHEGPGNQWQSHIDGYVPVMTGQAANFVASRIQPGQPHLRQLHNKIH
jgi:cutinase